MPFVDPFGEMSPIEYHRRMFEKTKNPMHVWMVVSMGLDMPRQFENGYPDWVTSYLGTVAKRLYDLCVNADDLAVNVPSAVTEALELKRTGQGARDDAFQAWARQNRDHFLAIAVCRYLNVHPDVGPIEACAQLAEDSAERARRFRDTGLKYPTSADVEHSEGAYLRAWEAWQRFVEQSPWAPSKN